MMYLINMMLHVWIMSQNILCHLFHESDLWRILNVLWISDGCNLEEKNEKKKSMADMIGIGCDCGE